MKTDHYERILLAKEKELSTQIERAGKRVREQRDVGVGDRGDESVNDEVKAEQLQEADIDSATLNQVRDALKRIKDGIFGKCVVDGGPIEEKRLDAVPWTAYCIKHQQSLEKSNPRQTPTL